MSKPVRLTRKEQILADAEKRLDLKIKELQYMKAKRDFDIEEGLWDNIHKKRARGEKMRKKGEKGAPTQAAIDKAKAGSQPGGTSTSEAIKPQQAAMMKRVKSRFPKAKAFWDDITNLVKPKGQINSKRFVELGTAYDKNPKSLDKLIAKYKKEDK